VVLRGVQRDRLAEGVGDDLRSQGGRVGPARENMEACNVAPAHQSVVRVADTVVSDSDVWAFIRGRGLPYCCLYDEGFTRLGCIGCPSASRAGTSRDFARWPRYEALWMRAFQRIWERRTTPGAVALRDGREWFGKVYFRNWREMWEWWVTKGSLPDRLIDADEEDSCQIALDMLSGAQDDADAFVVERP
jgi:hypothetical protein